MKYLGFIILIFNFTFQCYAQSRPHTQTVERAGDILAIALPAAPLIMDLDTFFHGNIRPGLKDGIAYGASMGIAYLLKISINRTRPNGQDYSFPSGHATSAFSGATMIELKYGPRWGIPAYALATYVAYSRVYANKHYPSDVIAGAILGSLTTYAVYKLWPQNKLSISANWMHQDKSMAIFYNFR